jgi:hypothetical protein
MLRQTDSQQGSSEAADLEETKCTVCDESTTELDEGPDTCGVCFEHDVLDNVVMVRGRGPCSINYDAARGEGGVLREVVVSRKCAEAVLRGAHVCKTQDGHELAINFPCFVCISERVCLKGRSITTISMRGGNVVTVRGGCVPFLGFSILYLDRTIGSHNH